MYLGQATYGSLPDSLTIGRPAATQACMPPETFAVFQPALLNAATTDADRAPDRQMT
jgi:hypothetical protein